jgi:hypothetical protein
MTTTILLSRVLGSLLKGKIDGRRHFGTLCSALSAVQPGGVVLLDFRSVEDLSASWIAAALVPLLSWSALPEHDLYPVLTGIGEDDKKWLDEFELVAERSAVVFLVQGEPPGSCARMVGNLDPILLQTLRAVKKHGGVTGAELKRLYPGEPVGPSAWNNRLKDLHTKRLLHRATRGREQVYSVLLEVNLDGATGSGVADQHLPAADAAGGAGVPPPHPV